MNLKHKHKLKIIFFSLIGGFIMTLFTCRSCWDSLSLYLAIGSYTSIFWITMWMGNEGLIEYLDKKIPWTIQPIKRLVVGIVGMLFYTIGATLLLVQLLGLFIRNFGSTEYIVYYSVIITSVITVFMTSRDFLFNWRQTAINAEKFQKQSIAAKYENLKNQVNPHFLFNSLNALTNLVYEDQEKAVTFIKQLSEVYRYVLDTKDSEVVPLEGELRFLQSYLYLQQIRFGDKLQVTIKLDNTTSMIAPLALQMLIENAIKHNVVSQEHPLHIEVYSSEKYIIVQNELQRKAIVGEHQGGIGLDNIQKRYEYLSSYPVEITEADNKFIVKIPLLSTNYEVRGTNLV